MLDGGISIKTNIGAIIRSVSMLSIILGAFFLSIIVIMMFIAASLGSYVAPNANFLGFLFMGLTLLIGGMSVDRCS